MEDIKRIEGFVNQQAERILHKNGGVNFAGGMLDDEHVAATLFISKDATPPKVFSIDEVRALFKLMSEDMHHPSSRPCPTCRPITEAIGEPFGCYAHHVKHGITL